MKFGLPKGISNINGNRLVKNSFWGLASTILQTLFLSVLFIITSKHYNVNDFSNFLVANTLYQLTVGFSSMGLGHWFIRAYEENISDRPTLIARFIKIQTILGIIFYVINIIFVFSLYQDRQIHILAIILGTNVIFDNIIYAIKSLNIAEWQQKRTSVIMSIDGFLRLAVGCILIFYPLSIYYFSILSVLIRLITVNVFVNYGTNNYISFKSILKFKTGLIDFKEQVLVNWRFVVIAGMSIIFWRSATIVISKFLSSADIANYEIAYKIFSIFTILPLVASTTMYPTLVSLLAQQRLLTAKKVYELTFWIYTLVAIVCYAFIQSYSAPIITIIFGEKFLLAADSLKAMMLTFLLFPTVLLQANTLLAMKLEKIDMLCNIFALLVNLTSSIVGLYLYPNLSVVNYSIFGSFVIFHIIQSVVLIRRDVGSIRGAIVFYTLLIALVTSYSYLQTLLSQTTVFVGLILIIILVLLLFSRKIIDSFKVFQNLTSKTPSENTMHTPV